MKKIIKQTIRVLFGYNLMSVLSIFTSGLKGFIDGSETAFTVAHTVDSRTLRKIPILSLSTLIGERKAEIKMTVSKDEDGTLPLNQTIVIATIVALE